MMKNPAWQLIGLVLENLVQAKRDLIAKFMLPLDLDVALAD